MSFDFSGHVLRAPRLAPGNAVTSSEPTNGVVRDVRIPPVRSAASPEVEGLPGTAAMVDLAGDQYRAAVLQAPGTSPHEYLVWAAYSGQLAQVEDPTWWTQDGYGRIPVGTTPVTGTVVGHGDGTLKVIVADNGGRAIGRITHLVIARGDVDHDDDGWEDNDDPTKGRDGSTPYYVVVPTQLDQNPLSGIVTLTDDNVFTATGGALNASDLLTLFGGGLSLERGDQVVEVRYVLGSVKFWWTRNDRYETRFGWNDTKQRWMPYKGSGPVNLGTLKFDETYTLSPALKNLPVGSVLPGNALVGDEYAMVRLGSSAGALSTPVGVSDPDGFVGIQVVANGDVEEEYDFSGTSWAAVVGQTNGILQFNPQYVEKHAGKTLWYVYRGFSADADGVVGLINDEELFLSPVPGPTDHPFVRINNRTPLAVELVDTDADALASAPAEGSCVVALTTGRLVLSQADKDKADPDKTATFNKHFLGARIIYDGVALNAEPQPTKRPRPLVQDDGTTEEMDPGGFMYLRDAIQWPEDATTDADRGLGESGVLYLPDGTGAVPTPEGVDPAGVDIPVRPGGDTLVGPPQTLGIIRRIKDGVGDTILFSEDGAVAEVVVVARNSDLPNSPHSVPEGTVYIARELTTGVGGSRVMFSAHHRKEWADKKVYFLQASLNPATYTELARIYSKSRIVFRFDGDEVLHFAIDGTAHEWFASILPVQDFYTASEVAASIQAKVTLDGGTGVCRASGDRVVLESGDLDVAGNTVEIGWGSTRDLSGAAALGFLPGWLAETGKPNWLSDAGISLGLARSLLNLDRSEPDADYLAQYRLEEQVLSQSVQAVPFSFFDFPPVEDIAGYDEGVFFNLQTVVLDGDDLRIIDKRLGHYEEIEHRFDEGKFAWLGEAITTNQVVQRTSALNLGNPGISAPTLLPAPGINGVFQAAEDGGAFAVQAQGIDYILPDDGQSGTVQLVTRYGARVAFGGRGLYTQGGTTFSDEDATFTADLKPGDRIKLASGDAAGSYIVQSVTDDTHVEVQPPFIADAERATPWEAFDGYPDSVYDPAVVADQVYQVFNHLPEEPFRIRVLNPLGDIDPSTVDFSAAVEDANASGRQVSLRFGPVHPEAGVTATLTPLTLTQLGVVANNVLVLPDTTHVDEGAFSIRVGTVLYTPSAVAAFSNDPVGVEYLTADWVDGNGLLHAKGELKFNSTLLVELESSGVTLVEELRSSAALAAGAAEYDPKTGEVRISDADAATHDGKKLYFVEQMVTEEPGADVKVSPLIGAVSFRKPIKTGCLVEMEYWLADAEGRRVGGPDDTIIEFLPVFVRRETATRLTDHEFEIDSLGEHVIAESIEPIVYVGPKQQNFGGELDFTKDRPGNLLGTRLSFNRDLPTWATPVVTYAVFDALGGERAYTTSQKPVYRPPFFIPAGKDNFGLRGDRTGDFQVGQMLRIGAECFYITKLRYFPDPDTTRVDIYPNTTVEVGSRSPGNDVLTLVTAGPITPEVDYQGTPTATTAPAGFMQEVPLADFPFEPVYAKQNSITFRGDLTTFAVPGHIMEVDGLPLTIASAELSEDGTRTKLTFTAPFRYAITPQGVTVRLSYRPIYPPGTRQFVGVGPFVASEGVELVLFGEVEGGVEQPGRSLAEGTEFQIDPQTGVVLLVEPLQDPLGPGQRLLLSYTKIRVMEPFFDGGQVQFPRWVARYKHNVIPNEDNGYLGGVLTATYSFDNPDSFYYRALPLRSYLAEAVKEAVEEMKRGQSAAGGPQLAVPPGDNNWEKGNLGLLAQSRNLRDKDRAARTLLSFYNNAVNFFEQVDEAVTGKFIGDRDGKFRYWVGRGLEYAPPGYEDDITGELNPANVWAYVYNEANPALNITFLVDGDPLVDPAVATITDYQLAGNPISSDYLKKLMSRQRVLVRNDVDDILLLGASKPKRIKTNTFPYFTIEASGVFSSMGQPHRYSRLFPTTARVLFTLMPGIGSDVASGEVGTYSYSKVNPVTGELESTNGTQIGQVSNPVIGDIENVSASVLRLRLPRARIVSYHPNGLPADALFAGMTAITKPCCIVSQIPLAELPVDPATGYPDVSRFLEFTPPVANHSDTAGATSGNPDLALPGFQRGQRIGWGKPDGRLFLALYPEEYSLPFVGSTTLYTSVFVDEVLHGCVLTFQNRKDEDIASPYDLLVGTNPAGGTPAHLFEDEGLERGDTIYVVPPDADNPISDPATDSPSLDGLQQAALASPVLREGTDIKVGTDGRVIDISLPSWSDPFLFPIKEIVGQNVPDPLSHLEGSVEFANTAQLPLNIPALQGQGFDDSGDQQIPFLKGTNSELDRFDEIQNVVGPLLDYGVPGGYYPDEIRTVEGEIITAPAVSLGGGFYKEPATLMLPVPTDPAAGAGVAPAQEGDFVLLEADAGGGLGWQGFLTIGRLRNATAAGQDWSWVEPPRFVTQVSKGSQVSYELHDYAVYTTPGNYPNDPQTPGNEPAGVRLYEDLVTGTHIISLQDIPLTLNDGQANGVGNLNSIIAADPNNVVRVKLLSRTDNTAINDLNGGGDYTPGEKDGRVILSIEIRQNDMRSTDHHGNTTGWLPHTGVTFGTFNPPVNPHPLTNEALPGSVANYRHIEITFAAPGANAFLFTPGVGLPNEWFLPHVVAAGVSKSSIYGLEFALDVETTAGYSDTASIDSDRLTFHEVIDFSLARPRGFVHELANRVYQTHLRVTSVQTPVGPSALNDVTGAPLTFLSRTGSTMSIEGTWQAAGAPAAGDEDGSIRVMAFEGYDSGIPAEVPITASGIVASVVPSQATVGGNPILEGTGIATYDRIQEVAISGGAYANVEKGDMLYIDRSNNALLATEKMGSYLVRYVIEPTVVPAGAQPPYLPVTVAGSTGPGQGFITTTFPKVVSLDVLGQQMVVEDPSGVLTPLGTGRIFCMVHPEFLNDTDVNLWKTSVFSVDFTGVAPGPGSNFTLSLGAANTWRWADGGVLAVTLALISDEITEELVVGKRLGWHDNAVGGGGVLGTGRMTLDVSIRGGLLPDDSSVVGVHTALPAAGADDARYGLHSLTFESAIGSVNVPIASMVTAAPAGAEVQVVPATPHANETFDPTNEVPVYSDVPAQITVQFDITLGDPLYNLQPGLGGPHVSLNGTSCLLPGTEVRTEDAAGSPAFFAVGGVFLEPSLPEYPFDLEPTSTPNVVDGVRSMVAGTVGMLTPGTPEDIHFEVRRVRRWHGAQNAVNDAFTPLRYVYEIRRGRITAFTRDAQQFGLVTAANFTMDWSTLNDYAPDIWNDGKQYDGTNLGGFNDPNVNIHPGDLFRLLDDDGNLLAEAVISQVVSATQLRLEPPAFGDLTAAEVAAGDRRFEVWLRQAPVPHEQTNEQLLTLITDRVVMETVADRSDADPANWTGGYVPEVAAAGVWADIANLLYDDTAAGVNFIEEGVRKGDIVIIDPAGTLPVVDERGTRPLGDRSVPGRTALDAAGLPAASPHIAQQVSSLDDNRGFYRVLTVNADHLVVDPIHTFAGSLGSDVLMATTQTHLMYAIYPTVGSSVLNSGGDGEGQNDLRPTRKAVGGTYTDLVDPVLDKHSIRPFSYKVIRPNSMFGPELIDTVLMMRERMLSLIELFRSASSGGRGGYYWDWQSNIDHVPHVEDLGDPADPDTGLGLFPNALVTTLVGEVGYSPFINTNDCLSLLDRRFWIFDRRLDSLRPHDTNEFAVQEFASPPDPVFPRNGGPYTAYTDLVSGGAEVRPLLLDNLGLILDTRDRLRAIRYTWLAYRTHRYIGTLAAIKAFDDQLPARLEERQRTLLLEQSSEGVPE